MAYNTKSIVRDKDGNPVAQYYNPGSDQYEPVMGAGGGSAVILYNEDGTENNSLSLIPILDKLSQLTGTVIDEETRKSNELQRISLYDQISQMLADGELKGDKGDVGLGLEFDWNGTQLGVRIEGDTEYVYVDLRGPQGGQGLPGTIENLDKTHIEDALGYVPADEDIIGMLTDLTTDEKANLVAAINEVKTQSNHITTDSLIFRRALDSNDDMNLIIEPGIYRVGTEFPQNFVGTTTSFRYASVNIYVSGSYVVQEVTLVTQGRTFRRTLNTSGVIYVDWWEISTTDKIDALTFTNGWSAYNTTFDTSVCKVGNIVNISMLIKNPAPNMNNITILPHKPTKPQILKCLINAGSGTVKAEEVRINTDGSLKFSKTIETHDWVSIVDTYNL